MSAQKIEELDRLHLELSVERINRMKAQVQLLEMQLNRLVEDHRQAVQNQEVQIQGFRMKYELGESDKININDGAIVRTS